MKRLLRHRSRRWGYDGWALMVRGADKPLEWTASTTRAEVRDIRRGMDRDLFQQVEIVKVKINVEVVIQ